VPNGDGDSSVNGHGPILLPNELPSTPDVADRQERYAAYLAAMAPAISGNGGHSQTFDAACVGIKGFGLSTTEAFPILDAWNQTCQPPWDTQDLWHKLQSADEKGDDKPRGYLYESNGNRLDMIVCPDSFVIDGDPETNGHVKAKPTKKKKGFKEAVDDPHRLARIFIESECLHPDGITIRFYRDSFLKWDGLKYKDISTKQVNSCLNKSAKSEFIKRNRIAIRMWIERGKTNDKGKKCEAPDAIKVTTRLIGDVSQALTSFTLLDSQFDAPAWIGGDSKFDPIDIIPCKNGLVHIPSFISGIDFMTPMTPRFFGTYALSYDFDPNASDPVEWLAFLKSIWPDDQDSIDTLQEWFGYCLTADTRQQKILGLIGPKRAGKDTIARVLRAMIGSENVVGPTMASVATNFGLAPWIDKPLAIISDARLSGRTDAAIVVERLLTVSGEGTLSIDRKYTTSWNGKLPTRIMIISNELPRLADSSGALASRLIILKLLKSFYGSEDVELFVRLSRELPGILLWAIRGWQRLQDRGFFVQPKSGRELVEELEDLSSPIGVFFRDRCIRKEGVEIEISELYRFWKYWCDDNGRKEHGDIQSFGRNMSALLPDLKIVKRRVGKKGEDGTIHEESVRRRYYAGIDLNPDWENAKVTEKVEIIPDVDENPPF
jgi:putative DNA primase/helicase